MQDTSNCDSHTGLMTERLSGANSERTCKVNVNINVPGEPYVAAVILLVNVSCTPHAL